MIPLENYFKKETYVAWLMNFLKARIENLTELFVNYVESIKFGTISRDANFFDRSVIRI